MPRYVRGHVSPLVAMHRIVHQGLFVLASIIRRIVRRLRRKLMGARMIAELKIRPLRKRSTYSTSFRCTNGLTKAALNDSPSEKCNYPRLIGGIQLETVGTNADTLSRALRASCFATLQEKQYGVWSECRCCWRCGAYTRSAGRSLRIASTSGCQNIRDLVLIRQERFEHPSTEYIILLLGSLRFFHIYCAVCNRKELGARVSTIPSDSICE